MFAKRRVVPKAFGGKLQVCKRCKLQIFVFKKICKPTFGGRGTWTSVKTSKDSEEAPSCFQVKALSQTVYVS
jgi:hypothetical protein